MALPRESTFLPMIKCSLCGNQVEIFMMGDHLCRGPTAELSSPDSKDLFDDFSQPSYSSYGTTPPTVDTDAAKRQFMDSGQLTPVSQPGESRDASPTGRVGPRLPQSPMHAQRPGGYGGFSDARRDSDRSAPRQPVAAGSLVDRANSKARGPFDAPAKSSSSRNPYASRMDSLDMWDGPSMEEISRGINRPGTSHSNASAGAHAALAVPKAPCEIGYGGFGPPSTYSNRNPTTQSFISRSETYPKPSPPVDVETHRRLSSAPGGLPDLSPTAGRFGDDRKRLVGPDRTRRPPPRKSLLGQHTHRDSGSVDLVAEFGVGNPYSSGGSSSGYSYLSDGSHMTAQTSPARSHTQRDKDVDELQVSMRKLRPRDLRIGPSARHPTTDSSYGCTTSSPQDLRHDAAPAVAKYDSAPRAYDTALLHSVPYGSPPREPGSLNHQGRRPGDPRHGRAAGSGAREDREPMRLPFRGYCKACRLPIRGKSISSADGRLTGKYHKACFVCATCSEPFTSVEFYVLGDRPYCEQHYHKLNGSLCGSCGRGIEGQYAEDESCIKHHVGCFRCLDCGQSLSDGYFEVDGEAFCERDAWKRTQPLTPGHGIRDDDAYPPGESLRGGPRGRPPPRSGSAAGGMPRGPRFGDRLEPSAGLGRLRPQMNKRMTRIGRM